MITLIYYTIAVSFFFKRRENMPMTVVVSIEERDDGYYLYEAVVRYPLVEKWPQKAVFTVTRIIKSPLELAEVFEKVREECICRHIRLNRVKNLP